MIAIAASLLVPAVLAGGPEPPDPGSEWLLEAELGYGLNKLQPHPTTAIAVGGAWTKPSGFRASLQVAAEYAGPFRLRPGPTDLPTPAGTPADFGHVLRVGPRLRLGAVNHFAWGYFFIDPGWGVRLVGNECDGTPGCEPLLVEHGVNIGVGLGGLVPLRERYWLGGELDWDNTGFFDPDPRFGAWAVDASLSFIAGVAF